MGVKITKKTELLIERERRVTFKFGARSNLRFCAMCQTHARFFTIDEAALIRQATARQIFRLVEADALHWLETDNGLLIVCSTSLAAISSDTVFLSPKIEIPKS